MRKKTLGKQGMSLKSLMVIYISFILIAMLFFSWMSYYNIKEQERTLISNAENQLNYLSDRLNVGTESVEYSVANLLENTVLRGYYRLSELGTTERVRGKKQVIDEAQKMISSSQTLSAVDVFWQKNDSSISINQGVEQEYAKQLHGEILSIDRPGWYHIGKQNLSYINFSPYVAGKQRAVNYDYVVIGKLRQNFIYNLLEQFSTNPGVKTFFSFENNERITLEEVPNEITAFFDTETIEEMAAENSKLHMAETSNYVLLTRYNRGLKSFLTSYIKMDTFSKQTTRILWRTLTFLLFLLLGGIVVLVFFYFSYFKNLSILIKSLKQAGKGEYSYRIQTQDNKEFQFVFDSFNDMASQTEQLIDRLETETSLREYAEYRQLQTQINPHFLYNNFNFITTMAETSPQSVIAMSRQLSEYYRYITDKNLQNVTLEQELRLSETFLTIMSLRKSIDYVVDCPEEIASEPFMFLLVQPLVENAIFHGIEKRFGSHQVSILASIKEEFITIAVMDDGKGMSRKAIETLEKAIMQEKPNQEGSIGLWNVNQRLINTYGNESRLKFQQGSILSTYGLTVSFTFKRKQGSTNV